MKKKQHFNKKENMKAIVYLPAVGERCSSGSWGSSLRGGEVVLLVTIKVAAQTLNLWYMK
jgi:hypothetical protein